MDSPGAISNPRIWTIAEHSVGGHRLAYVSHLAQYLLHRHHEVRLRLPRGAQLTPEFSAHLARVIDTYGNACETSELPPIDLRRYSAADWATWLSEVIHDDDRDTGLLIPMADWLLPHLAAFLRTKDPRRVALVLMPFTLKQYYAEVRRKSFHARWKRNELSIREIGSSHSFTGVSVVRSASHTGSPASTLAYPGTRPIADLVTVDYQAHEKTLRSAPPIDSSACLLVGDISRRKDFSFLITAWASYSHSLLRGKRMVVAGRLASNLTGYDVLAFQEICAQHRVRHLNRYLPEAELDRLIAGAGVVVCSFDGTPAPSGIVSRAIALRRKVVGWGNPMLERDLRDYGRGVYLRSPSAEQVASALARALARPVERASTVAWSNASEFGSALMPDVDGGSPAQSPTC